MTMAPQQLGVFLILLCPVFEASATCTICPRGASMCVRDLNDQHNRCTHHVHGCIDITGYYEGQIFNGEHYLLAHYLSNNMMYVLGNTAECQGSCCYVAQAYPNHHVQVNQHFHDMSHLRFLGLTQKNNGNHSGVLINHVAHDVQYFCKDTWTLENTVVACRHLHLYLPSATVEFHPYPNPQHVPGLIGIQCDGSEHLMHKCHGYPQESINCSELVQINCWAHQGPVVSSHSTPSPQHGYGGVTSSQSHDTLAPTLPPNFPVRLNSDGGLYAGEGRVEVFINGQWGTVCNNGWTWHNTVVICRMMGFNTAHSHTTRFKEGTGPIHLTQVACQGSEKSLSECRYTTTASAHCSHYEDVGVMCHDDITTPTTPASTSHTPGSTYAWHIIT